MRTIVALLACSLSLAAVERREAPRHLIGVSGPLTAPSAAPPRAVARDFIRNLALSHGLSAADLEGLYVFKEYRTAHNGVTHLVFRQQFHGLDVYNAEWTVNVDRDGRVLNAGGALAQQPASGPPAPGSAPSALRAARASVRPAIGPEPAGQAVWFRVNGVLRPAWVFNVLDENGIDCYATVVDAATQRILARTNLTLYQSPPRGLVFERQSPQPNPAPGHLLTAPPPYVERTVQSFAGDPLASPRGWVSGSATAGNNVVAIHNPLGVRFLEGGLPAVSLNLDFSFPLALGPGAPNPIQFRDAATTNLFYWANRAHDLFYQYGFDEAAGNFQQDNYGRGGVAGDPMLAFSQFGAAANASASLNNAFFTSSRYEDGSRASINLYLGGSVQEGVFSDVSYDAQSILHEYTHGVSSRLVRQAYDNHQGGAMGEGWSDFFALEFTVPEGAPPDGAYVRGEYAYRTFGPGIRTRPFSTNLEVNPLTFKSLGRVTTRPQVHADGEIWVQALWEMRASLIRQFGEREGRRRTRLLVIDGMKLSPPAPTMVDARDAILLADRAGFNGASQQQIWEAFARRGLGVLAHSATPDSIHVLASFEKPSTTGALRFYEDQYVAGETVRVVLHDANNPAATTHVLLTTASGDSESLLLRRAGSLFWGSLPSSYYSAVTRSNGYLELIPWDYINAYYVDADAGGSPRLVDVSVPVRPQYALLASANRPPVASSEERALFSILPGLLDSGLNTRVALPFAFPFFDQHFTSVRVYSDGLLAFDLPRFAPCSDWAGLSLTNGIAPLWMDLGYGGSAQKSENVYMSSGPGWVTFRWAAETQPYYGLLLRPEPVNFAATLHEDGRIVFQYGEGNKNLVNSPVAAPVFGCQASGPTVGISNGHETYLQVSSAHDGRPDLEKALTLTFEPPLGAATAPVVKIESPVPEARYQGVLTVRGIAWDDEWTVARLDVLIDGVARARTSPNVSRSDFCATQRVRGCPTVGFNISLNPARLGLTPGPHQLRIRATNVRGSFVDYPDEPLTFFVDPEQSRPATGALEAPAEGAELSGSVTVRGWAYAQDVRLRAVDVLINGLTYGAATYGQRRDDVCGPLAEKPLNCPNVGFTFNLNTRTGAVPLPNGSHTLQVRARDELGRYTLIPEVPLTITVNNTPNQLPRGVVTAPQPNERLRGKVTISGYAWDPDGRVTSAALLLNGSSVLTLRYGLPRPEECQPLPDAQACPDIGFEGELDTTQFANGPHVLGVRLTDNSGATIIIPALARYGMNIFIDN